MVIEDISPIIFSLGPIEVRWYGVMIALSFVIGSYLFLKHGKQKGINEDILLTAIIAIIVGGVVGARLIYVLTNFPYFVENPEQIIRLDRGGLAFHGALLGGLLGGWLIAYLNRLRLHDFLDLAVPGIAIGYMLVRTANIFNQEVLGRFAAELPWDRHPAQVYGILIGLILLLLHYYWIQHPRNRPGMLFWSFIFHYSLLRGVIEETFRDNPLYLGGYISEAWGIGFFTLTQIFTPPLLLLAWYMRQRASTMPQMEYSSSKASIPSPPKKKKKKRKSKKSK